MKKLRQKKAFRVFVFNTFTAFIALLTWYLSYLAGLDWTISIVATTFLIPVLASASKFINVYVFDDIGVEKWE